jgi:hypothetical protein
MSVPSETLVDMSFALQGTAAAESHPCQLVKMPALTRQQHVSPFAEEGAGKKGGTGLHRPTVVDMAKPQAPLEGAWGKQSPSVSARTSIDSSSQQGTPTTKIVPTAGGSSRDGTSSRRSLFIGSNPSNAAAPVDADEASANADKRKSKCVIC